MKSILLLIIFFAGLIIISCNQSPLKKPYNKVKLDTLDSQQLIVVTTNDWNDFKGKFYCYEKENKKWELILSDSCVVGRNGLGIGLGIKTFQFPDAPIKIEGDLKSPAGIFKIGNAFGYANKKEVSWLKVPYIESTNDLLCIDDGNSLSYNQFVYSDTKKKDWNSCEKMHLKNYLYKWGLFVEHNPTRIPGKGSCIFIHIWESNNKGTTGCTAMSEDNILKILHWIDVKKKPLLVQFPKREYEKVLEKIELPKI